MAKRLLLVRHARVAANDAGRFIGSTDLALDDLGHWQARALAGRVAQLAPERCYCSPMQRCTQTAQVLVGHLAITLDNDLREIDFGRWENCNFAQVRASDPALVDRWATLAPDFAFPGGECLAGFFERVRSTADRLVEEPVETVLVVTHGGVIRAMLCYLLGLDPRHYVVFHVGCASLAVIDLFDGQGVLSALESAAAPLVAVPPAAARQEICHG
jgi:alpha-ribazole phosphatase